MHASAGDVLLLTVPFLAILVLGFFRLDQVLFTPTRARQRATRPRFANFEQDNDTLADPDGQISRRKTPAAQPADPSPARRTA